MFLFNNFRMDQNKRAKFQNAEKEDHGPSAAARDQLSDLPNALAHHILSLVPTIDAIRMSLVSKCWRDVWYSLPVIEFSDADARRKEGKHKRFVSKCLRLRRRDLLNTTDTAITTFKLRTFRSTRNVDCWLKLVAKSRIKDLDLYFCPDSSTVFKLPSDVLRIRSLTRLRLINVRMENSLQSLVFQFWSLCLCSASLWRINLCDLLSGCSALVKLVLDDCKGLSVPRIQVSRYCYIFWRRNISS